MRVPLLDVRRQNEPLARELTDAFQRVLASGQYVLGRELEEFEREAAAVAGARYGIGVSSGTDAILLALMTLGVGPGDEVACPSFTFFATAGCVARVGATPVFVDSCPVCFNIDPAALERSLTPRTKAVIPVHLYGQAAHMQEIMSIARARGLAVVEDAAQAIGAQYHGCFVGSIGDFGAFSFYPSKNLGGFGDAGLLTTNDAALAEKARLLRCHGAAHKYFHDLVGGNFRMDPLQAALLRVKLPHLGGYSAARARNAAAYTFRLGGLPTAAVSVLPPAAHPGNVHIWNQYTIRAAAGAGWRAAEPPRDVLKKFLDARGIGSEIYYPLPLHQQRCFAADGPPKALPVCERLARECLSIPVFPELTPEERDAVAAAITDFVQEAT